MVYYVAFYNKDKTFEQALQDSRQRIINARNPPLKFINRFGSINSYPDPTMGKNTLSEAQKELKLWRNGPNGKIYTFVIIDDHYNLKSKDTSRNADKKYFAISEGLDNKKEQGYFKTITEAKKWAYKKAHQDEYAMITLCKNDADRTKFAKVFQYSFRAAAPGQYYSEVVYHDKNGSMILKSDGSSRQKAPKN